MSLLVSAFPRLLVLVLIFSELCIPCISRPSCPLNFSTIRELLTEAPPKKALIHVPNLCGYITEGLRLVRAEYLRNHGFFNPPPGTFQVCWESYQEIITRAFHVSDIQSTCGYHPEEIWGSCLNITSQAQFENHFPESKLHEMRFYCNQSLENSLVCESCTKKLSSLAELHLFSGKDQNASLCSGYLYMYASAVINQLGPTHPANGKCFFRFQYSVQAKSFKRDLGITSGVLLGCMVGITGSSLSIWLFWMLQKGRKRESTVPVGAGFGSKSTNLVKFNMEDIREATKEFSRHNLIGRGGYGNVYKGILPDGSQAAFKRFKNCAASGDASFAHEVEIIASVKHVNLLAVRGYCTAASPVQGHQRVIVCDLMHNGSLYDHLFGSEHNRPSWPIRQRIAYGTARGLAYLHYGVHPAIIHRDIKTSNILLDETFEPKLADFGLAKFISQGMTHLNTKVAGTLGYVAPEYALYGKLTERSDVYSFGVVLLELLSGRKAYETHEGKVTLLTDWARSLVMEGRALDVVEVNMSELGSPQVMEQYVHLAAICAHPMLHARPSMDQIVNILETNQLVEPPHTTADDTAPDSEIISICSSYPHSCSEASDDS